MKYNITRKCGHEDRIEVFGTNVHGERDKKVAHEETKLCKECYKKTIAESNTKSGMVELTGSEKQIAWAEKIRDEKISEVEKTPAPTPESESNKQKLLSVLKNQVEAKWWIDHRDSSIVSIIKELF